MPFLYPADIELRDLERGTQEDYPRIFVGARRIKETKKWRKVIFYILLSIGPREAQIRSHESLISSRTSSPLDYLFYVPTVSTLTFFFRLRIFAPVTKGSLSLALPCFVRVESEHESVSSVARGSGRMSTSHSSFKLRVIASRTFCRISQTRQQQQQQQQQQQRELVVSVHKRMLYPSWKSVTPVFKGPRLQFCFDSEYALIRASSRELKYLSLNWHHLSYNA
ncbi:hypothetical protein PoB_006500600 [Plakobranchus ocellatus]|uniref:Uncharacterized protein n=1 Tax=Plakobranchus ocellatus TaxID=259542 RepID=A0AAV4D2U3_9GAST|nr:hypothetical protein PoB_006500600 [Plakobranchus ocellatus]